VGVASPRLLKHGMKATSGDAPCVWQPPTPTLPLKGGGGRFAADGKLSYRAANASRKRPTVSLNAAGWSRFTACPAAGITIFSAPGIFAAM
jgi:hypothetical protein